MSVVGKRLSFWVGMSSKQMLFIFVVAPICVFYAVRGLIGLPDPNGLTETVLDVVLSLAGLGVGAYAYASYRGAQDTFVIESPCPSCGTEASRNFLGSQTEQTWVTPCGSCLAYLRITRETLDVREESIDALDEAASTYRVAPVQYETLVRREDDREKSFKFAVPPVCAICGSPDAPVRREIRVDGYSPAPKGLFEAVTWKSQGNPVHQPSHGERLDDAMGHVATQVCAKHAPPAYARDPLISSYGTLSFVSYRYYKAFCDLNQIAGPETAAALVSVATAGRDGRHRDDQRVRGRKSGS